MTNEQLKELENTLWDSANSLRAYGGLKAADYAVPVLGLIFLKFADNRYSQVEKEINEEFDKTKNSRVSRSIEEIAMAKCGFYLPETSRFDYLLNLPGEQSMAKALRTAMEGIEEYQDAKFQDVLPKEAYFDIEKKKDDILPQLLKSFSNIPQDATGDVFGKIYEYFLGKFALSEGQKGGEFFTPTSVVRFIVEVIEPYSGKIYDPACGSGGMFVQSATFIKQANHDLNDIYVYGQEYMGETVRLAKMNLLVNNLRGEITETNSYEDDPYDGHGKFDFVMANPPFNVKSVKESTVKDDPRFYEYGLPKSKGKKDDKISDANYLWISLFATSLNDKGRAGFVMPNSASDARNAEYDIRKNLVDSGIVDCMVSMPSNMFFTVTLPATLWFFDKNKINTDRKDKILFLDARNVYRQIDRAHREWTEEQQQNLATIVRLYRGENERFLELIDKYLKSGATALEQIEPAQEALKSLLSKTYTSLKEYVDQTKNEKRTPAKKKEFETMIEQLNQFEFTETEEPDTVLNNLLNPIEKTALENGAQHEAAFHLSWHAKNSIKELEALKKDVNNLIGLFKQADKYGKLKNDKAWTSLELSRSDKELEDSLNVFADKVEELKYWSENIQWLQKRFPDGEYQDVIGLCKVAGREDYVDEQEYSLNAGRYVGVEIEGENISREEFYNRITSKSERFNSLTSQSYDLESKITNLTSSIKL